MQIAGKARGALPRAATRGDSRRRIPGRRRARAWSDLRTFGLRSFFRSGDGGVAIESALSIVVLVVVCGGLMAIAHAAYTDDRMGRAARAAARAIAMTEDGSSSEAALGALACAAIRREFALDSEFDCGGAWTIAIDTDLTPAALLGGSAAEGEAGDIVRVQITWQNSPWAQAVYQLQGDGAGAAVGVARREQTS